MWQSLAYTCLLSSCCLLFTICLPLLNLLTLTPIFNLQSDCQQLFFVHSWPNLIAQSGLTEATIMFSQSHYYQPLWTLVGGGINRLEDSVRPTGSLIPGGCTWYKTSIAEFNPEKNLVLTAFGDEVIEQIFLIIEVIFLNGIT